LDITQAELLGKTVSDDFWQIENEEGTNFKNEEFPVLQSIKQLKPVNKVVMGIHRTGKKDLVWVLVDAVPILDQNGEFLYVICSFSDITAQKHTEQALKISNDRFKYATKATSDVIWDWEIGSDNIVVGENYTQLYGYNVGNPNNILSVKDSFNYIHPLDLQRLTASITETFKSKMNIWQEEFRYLKPDGTYAIIIGKAYIIRNKENKAIRMIGAHSDVTTEKKLRDKLTISEQHFRGAFEHSAVGFAIIDRDGYWIEANARLCHILGYSKEELKKLTCTSISYPDDLETHLALKAQLDQCLIPNFNMEKRYLHKNQSIVWVHLSVSLIKNSTGGIMHYITQLVDITERKKIEKVNKLLIEANNKSKAAQLNKAKNLYQLLAENTVDLVCLHDLDGNFQYVSPSVQKLLGYDSKDLIGKNPLEFTHPEDIEYLQKNLHDLLTTKKEIASEVRLKNKAGRYIWFESKANLVKVNGTPVSFHSGTREITKQREAQESIEKSLTQERKLNELRTNLVSTISHEFRTPMTTIRTSTELMELYLEGLTFKNSDRLQKHLYTITNEIDRIVELMNTVLTISREDSGKTSFRPIIFDLQQVCLDVIETSYSNQKDSRKVKTTIEGVAFPVLADKNLMEYALFNILNNAFKYSEGFGNIHLNLFITGTTVIIEIEDFGIGIPKLDQHKLFNTFFRASNTNGIQGTGLGLYIVKTFTEKNSGAVKLESKLGKGTKITLEFPLHSIK
jgi:PAS domain S-box-containing protein